MISPVPIILLSLVSLTFAKNCTLFDYSYYYQHGIRIKTIDVLTVEISWRRLHGCRYLAQINGKDLGEVTNIPFKFDCVKKVNVLKLTIIKDQCGSTNLQFRFSCIFNPDFYEPSPLSIKDSFSTGVVLKWQYTNTNASEVFWIPMNSSKKEVLKRVLKNRTSQYTTINGLRPGQKYKFVFRAFSENSILPKFFVKTDITKTANEITQKGENWVSLEWSVSEDKGEDGFFIEFQPSSKAFKQKIYRIVNPLRKISNQFKNYYAENVSTVDLEFEREPKVWSGRISITLTNVPVPLKLFSLQLIRHFESGTVLREAFTNRNLIDTVNHESGTQFDCYDDDDLNGWTYTQQVSHVGSKGCMSWKTACNRTGSCSDIHFSDGLSPLNTLSLCGSCCRNPIIAGRLRDRPWCFVNENDHPVKQYCNIASCKLRKSQGNLLSMKMLQVNSSSATVSISKLNVGKGSKLQLTLQPMLSQLVFLSPSKNVQQRYNQDQIYQFNDSKITNFIFSSLKPGLRYRLTAAIYEFGRNIQFLDFDTSDSKPESSSGLSVTVESRQGLTFSILKNVSDAKYFDYKINYTGRNYSKLFYVQCITCPRRIISRPSNSFSVIKYEALNPTFVDKLSESEFLGLHSVSISAYNSIGFGPIVEYYPTRLSLNCSIFTTSANKKAILVEWYDPLSDLTANNGAKLQLSVNWEVLNISLTHKNESFYIYSDIIESKSYCFRMSIEDQQNRASPITCLNTGVFHDYVIISKNSHITAFVIFFTLLIVIAIAVLSVFSWIKYKKLKRGTPDFQPIIELNDTSYS